MTAPHVVLVGYYGRGNFGDDVLMTVAHGIARVVLPGAAIAVRVEAGVSYPSRLIGEKVISIPFGTREKHRLIIHGGGGTFFDFKQNSLLARCGNSLLLSGGVRAFVHAEKALRLVANKPRMSAQTRIGLGLGVGTFTSGSSKLLEALPLLADFDHLWVRDQGSKSNLEKLSVGPLAIVGSDLAFLSDDWCPVDLKLAPRAKRGGKPKVGVILRDWPVGSGPNFGEVLRPIMMTLSQNYDITLISFDPTTDSGTLYALKELPQQIWDPQSSNFASFSKMLSGHDALLTSRAHGAICGACLGRPSVILNIEPKLAAVHAMLPNATRLVRPSANAVSIAILIEEVLAIPIDSIAEDVMFNRASSENALKNIVQRFVL